MSDRIPCMVPFCRRTASREKFPNCDQIICGKHWRMAPVLWRRRHSRLVRRYHHLFDGKGWWQYPPESLQRRQAIRLARLCDQMWDRCKQAVIEAAAGI